MTHADRIERRQQAQEMRDQNDLVGAWEAMKSDDLDAADLRLQRTIAVKLGAPELCWQVVTALAAHADADARTLTAAAAAALRSGDPIAAGQIIHHGLGRYPEDSGLLGLRARVAVALAADDAVETIQNWVSAGADRTEAGELMASVGAFDEAQALWTDGPSEPLARLALWTGDTAGALTLLGNADSFEARRIRAGCLVLDGAPEAALTLLDGLTAEQPRDAEAHVWRAETLLALDRPAEAMLAADQAMTASRSYPLVARTLRWLAAARSAPHPGLIERALDDDLVRQLEPLTGPEPDKSEAMLEGALKAFGGNRSTSLTTFTEAGPVLYPSPPDIRDQARKTTGILRVRGPEAAWAALDDLLERNDHPLVRTHRGEFALWFGWYDVAQAEFEAAIDQDQRTRWAWIGLGATHMCRGDRDRAEETWSQGLRQSSAGPTMFAYRGENRRMLGDLDAAESDLLEALKTSPRRLATHINLALVAHARDDSGPASELASQLAGLCSDLGGTGAPHEQLEAALVRMKGNRSSSLVSWYDDQGRFRILRWQGPDRPS